MQPLVSMHRMLGICIISHGGAPGAKHVEHREALAWPAVARSQSRDTGREKGEAQQQQQQPEGDRERKGRCVEVRVS